MHGARVVVRSSNHTIEAVTALDGSFRIQIPGGGQTFTLSVIPPSGQGLAALTYEDVPLSAYRSEYGAASELNIYLPGPPSRTLPGYPARTGYVSGQVTLNGNPVVSSTPRSANQLFDPPMPGEDGLVVFGGGRVVTTDATGSYSIPVVSTNNLFAASGSLWAGSYTGTDTGDFQTATEYYWSAFGYIPEVRVYLGASSPYPATVQDIGLESFDGPKVVPLEVRHDYTRLTGFVTDPQNQDWNAFGVSIPYFIHAIHSAEIELGQYYYLGQSAKSLKIYALPSGATSQQIQVVSSALRFDPSSFQILDLSRAYHWRDGTNLTQPLVVPFLDTPKLSLQDGITLSSRPILTWQGVAEGRVYVVSVYDDQGRLVWAGFTPNTSITVPVPLTSGSTYTWDVYTDDQTELLDYIGFDPAGLQARLAIDLERHPRLKDLKDTPVNAYRRELARAFLERVGFIPHAAYQRLLQNGYRESVSETRSFTVQ